MVKCTFCKCDVEVGTGTTYVKNDGKILYFCSSKCHKNVMKLKRNPANAKWVTKK